MDLMEVKGKRVKYEKFHKEIREKYDEAKEKWINDKCRNTEQTMNKNIEEIFGKKTCSSTGCLKLNNGNSILKKKKILKRWAEYM